jgi:hypothetical protein
MNFQLFELIKSLTKEEKRFFKLRTSYDKDSNYLKLFEAIDKQTRYDEQAIRKKFAGESWLANFSATKRYLYDTLLETLQFFNNTRNNEHKLLAGIQQFKVLYDKALYDQAQTLLDKLKKQTYEFSDVAIRTILYNKELLLQLAIWKFQSLDSGWLKNHNQKTKENIRASVAYVRYIRHQTYLSYWHNQGKHHNPKIWAKIRLIQTKLLAEAPAPFLQLALMYWHNLLHASYILHDYQHAYTAAMEILPLFAQNPHIIKERPNSYAAVVGSACQLSVQTQHWETYTSTYAELLRLCALPDNTFRLSVSVGIDVEWLYLFHALHSHAFEQGYARIPQALTFLLAHQKYIIPKYAYYLPYTAGALAFCQQKYAEALEHWQIFYQTCPPFCKIIQTQAYLLRLAIACLNREFKMLASLVRNTQRFLKSERIYNEFEQIWISFFRKIGKNQTLPNETEKETFHRKLKHLLLETFPPDLDNPLGYFPYIYWLDKNLGQ